MKRNGIFQPINISTKPKQHFQPIQIEQLTPTITRNSNNNNLNIFNSSLSSVSPSYSKSPRSPFTTKSSKSIELSSNTSRNSASLNINLNISERNSKSYYESEITEESFVKITKQLTACIQMIYNKCSVDLNEVTILTSPSIPVSHNSYDNECLDLIVRKGDILGNLTSMEGPLYSMNPNLLTRYQVIEILGSGTFGQVYKCMDLQRKEEVSIKILKNHPAYFRQGLLEIAILMILNNFYTIKERSKILRITDQFLYNNHLCIVTELLGTDLFYLMKENKNKGFSVRTIRKFLFQLLKALRTLSQANVVHCDVKPENILLQGLTSNIKLIDFGSACFENFTMHSYIQSRHYRAPEVVLGLPYSCAIDMWSLGCIAGEFFLGIPLFACSSEYNLLYKMIDMLGIPPDEMLERGKKTKDYFNFKNGKYELKSQLQYEKEKGIRIPGNKHYFSYHTLQDLIQKNPMKVSSTEIEEELTIRESLFDFLERCLAYDPKERLTPDQALSHPFIIGENMNDYILPPRDIEFKEYGNTMSMEGEEFIESIFHGEKDECSSNAQYYRLFMKALRKGEILNIMEDSPFSGSITPSGLKEKFDPKTFITDTPIPRREVPRKREITVIQDNTSKDEEDEMNTNSNDDFERRIDDRFTLTISDGTPELDNQSSGTPIKGRRISVSTVNSTNVVKRKTKSMFKEFWKKLTPTHSPKNSPRTSPSRFVEGNESSKLGIEQLSSTPVKEESSKTPRKKRESKTPRKRDEKKEKDKKK